MNNQLTLRPARAAGPLLGLGFAADLTGVVMLLLRDRASDGLSRKAQIMTRTLTPVPTTTAPNLRSDPRFRALIAAIVVATIALAAWTVAQQRTIDDTVGALPAPPQQSVRQIERADEAPAAALQRPDEVDVQRLTNQASALEPARPDAQDLQRMEQAELERFGDRGVQPAAEAAEAAQQRALAHSRPGVQP